MSKISTTMDWVRVLPGRIAMVLADDTRMFVASGEEHGVVIGRATIGLLFKSNIAIPLDVYVVCLWQGVWCGKVTECIYD